MQLVHRSRVCPQDNTSLPVRSVLTTLAPFYPMVQVEHFKLGVRNDARRQQGGLEHAKEALPRDLRPKSALRKQLSSVC